MCNFHSKTVYEMPIMQDIEYSWRQDDHSFLLSPVDYDIFEYMRTNHYKYGYRLINSDSPFCVTGLWNVVKAYVMLKNIKTQFFEQWTEPLQFYNNFEISDMSLWKSQEYKNYINYLYKLGKLYHFVTNVKFITDLPHKVT